MANISRALNVDLGGLGKSTNTQKTVVQLNSDPNGALSLDKKDPNLSSAVDYAAAGGGEAKLHSAASSHVSPYNNDRI